jgi:hypothetical protein
MLEIQNSCVFDGGGHFMHFAKDNPSVLIIAAGSNVVLKNVVLKNFSDLAISLGAGSSLTFGDGVSVELYDGQTISKTWVFDGNAIINGFGNSISLSTQNIRVMQNGSLKIENAELQGLSGNNLRCIGNAEIILNNTTLYTDRDFSITCGSLVVDGDVVLSGTNIFSYQSDQQSVINADSALIMTGGIIFDYAPSIANRDLIAMQDATSGLYLRGCALSSSHTGMRLTRGTLWAESKNFLTTTGTSLSEGICFGNGVPSDDLYINLFPGASLEVDGELDIQNAPSII